MNNITKVEGLTKKLRDAEGWKNFFLSFFFFFLLFLENELQAAASGQILGPDFYATLLLLQIAEGEIANARMTWKRVPTEHRNGSVLKAIHVVLAGLWKGG